jgi:hypothetical protein
MTVNDWWRDRPEERYWMIAPSRGVVGDALSAPKASTDRRFEWSHELVGFTEPGDTLFVWDRTLAVPTQSKQAGTKRCMSMAGAPTAPQAGTVFHVKPIHTPARIEAEA